MAAREYLKLTPPRRTAGFAVITVTRSNLWLGSDHLLCVETEGFSENYRRYYFQDIQTITVCRTNRAQIIGLATGILTLCFGIWAIAVNDVAGRWVLTTLAGVVGLPFILNFIYGPTCKCELRTAVQTENVPSLSRVWRARRVLDRIRPLIVQAQGQLATEEIALRFQERMTATGSEPPIAQPSAPTGDAAT
jgi:hypothetical protein